MVNTCIVKVGDKRAIVDREFEYFKNFKWYLSSGGYAARMIDINGVIFVSFMHRIVAGTPKGMKTDHINGNKLDNRKSNLRICNISENNRNCCVHKDNKSGFKGVYWDKSRNKWAAGVRCNKKHYTIGRFNRIEDAVSAYNIRAKELFGDFAKLNVL